MRRQHFTGCRQGQRKGEGQCAEAVHLVCVCGCVAAGLLNDFSFQLDLLLVFFFCWEYRFPSLVDDPFFKYECVFVNGGDGVRARTFLGVGVVNAL